MPQNNSNSLSEFVKDLIRSRGLDNLDYEIVVQLKADLRDRAESRVNAAILANLPPEKVEYFEKLLDQSSPDEVQSFCQRNIYGLDEIIANELAKFRTTYLNV
ncbi:MAG: hypothetical protein WC120_01195 [Parcubacteria group bacterium]